MSRFPVWVLLAWSLAVSPASSIVIDTDTTIDASNSINGNLSVIDGLTPPTVVDIVVGGSISGRVTTGDSSELNLRGGAIGGSVSAYDDSTVNVYDGSIFGGLPSFLSDSTTMNLWGGTVWGSIYADGASSVNMWDGHVGRDIEVTGATLNMYGGSVARHASTRPAPADALSTLNILGGTMRDVRARSGRVTLAGGVIENYLLARDDSIVEISGGEIHGRGGSSVTLENGSTATVTGGMIHGRRFFSVSDGAIDFSGGLIDTSLSLYESTGDISGGEIAGRLYASDSTVIMTAGLINSDIVFSGSSTLELYGGSVNGAFSVADSATMHIYGYDLDLTDGILTGTLADHTPLNHPATATEDGRFVLHNVPEPSAAVLFCCGAAMLIALVRRRSDRRSR